LCLTFGDIGDIFSDFRGYRNRDHNRDCGHDSDRAPWTTPG
jgi:hypothetical protein